jgi:hypothetical protein
VRSINVMTRTILHFLRKGQFLGFAGSPGAKVSSDSEESFVRVGETGN